VTITVEDTQSAAPPKVYTNPINRRFQPVVDTDAFATCP
jgi:hypothetical protein